MQVDALIIYYACADEAYTWVVAECNNVHTSHVNWCTPLHTSVSHWKWYGGHMVASTPL